MTAASEPVCVWPLAAILGEGPIWSAPEQALWFVDIKSNKIHRFDPATGEGKSFDTPEHVGFLLPDGNGAFVAGLKSGLYRFDPKDGSLSLLHRVDADKPGNRLNDGAIDPRGRLWFGSMDNGESAATGSLYRLDQSGPTAMDGDYVITNGPAFSSDGRLLYHTDTLKKIVYVFDLAEDGTLSDRRVFVTIEEGAGYPDGPVVDANGCVWTGLFQGWGVRQYSPQGKLLQTIRFPCANVTKIAFGGPDLKTAYATTATKGLSVAEREAQPLAGGLFRSEAGVAGLS